MNSQKWGMRQLSSTEQRTEVWVLRLLQERLDLADTSAELSLMRTSVWEERRSLTVPGLSGMNLSFSSMLLRCRR